MLGYFDNRYYWVLALYNKIEKFGFPNSQSWGDELYFIVKVWEVLSNEYNKYEKFLADKSKKKDDIKGVINAFHR